MLSGDQSILCVSGNVSMLVIAKMVVIKKCFAYILASKKKGVQHMIIIIVTASAYLLNGYLTLIPHIHHSTNHAQQ